jgi:hypothetical protein
MHIYYDLVHNSKANNCNFNIFFANSVLQCTTEHGFKDHLLNLRILGKNSIRLSWYLEKVLQKLFLLFHPQFTFAVCMSFTYSIRVCFKQLTLQAIMVLLYPAEDSKFLTDVLNIVVLLVTCHVYS